jgi:hypothetical protein
MSAKVNDVIQLFQPYLMLGKRFAFQHDSLAPVAG